MLSRARGPQHRGRSPALPALYSAFGTQVLGLGVYG